MDEVEKWKMLKQRWMETVQTDNIARVGIPLLKKNNNGLTTAMFMKERPLV